MSKMRHEVKNCFIVILWFSFAVEGMERANPKEVKEGKRQAALYIIIIIIIVTTNSDAGVECRLTPGRGIDCPANDHEGRYSV